MTDEVIKMEDKSKKAYELHKKGLSYRKIAEKLGVKSHNSVKYYIDKYKSEQLMTKNPKNEKTAKDNDNDKNQYHANSKFTDEILDTVKWMVRYGLTNKQIAKELNINESTFYRWLDAHEDLRKVVTENKVYVDRIVEDSLLKRALGYEYEEVTKEQKFGKLVITKIVKKEVPADVTAQKMWLINRQPDRWGDRHNIEMKAEHNHKFEDISEEKLIEEINKLRELNDK